MSKIAIDSQNSSTNSIVALDKSDIIEWKKIELVEIDSVDSVKLSGKLEKKKQTAQRMSWFFTFNNYKEEDIKILIDTFDDICNKFVFQEEEGEGIFSVNDDSIEIKTILKKGTKHLQGVIFLNKKMRPSEFNLTNKIHWEGTKSKQKAIEYCSKAKTRVGKTYVKGIELKKQLIIELDCNENNFYPYQKEIFELIKEKPDKRKIIWIYEKEGNTGKSEFIKYLGINNLSVQCSMKKSNDMINLINNKLSDEKGNRNSDDIKCICLDIPRSFDLNNLSYEGLEDIKNGSCVNTKYKCNTLYFNRPHIVIFSNYEPINKESLSNDRWKIGMIDKNKKIIWE